MVKIASREILALYLKASINDINDHKLKANRVVSDYLSLVGTALLSFSGVLSHFLWCVPGRLSKR